jgi:hypothetical protein
MRTPGPVDPLSLRLVNTGADRGAGLKAGASVFVEVRERLGSELYRVAIGGRLVTASSAFPLEPGSTLRARVERSSEGLSLRIVAREGAAAIAREAASSAASAGMPADPATRVAVAALLREGMAPEARALARVRRAALRDAESSGESSDLAAKMEAKGMPADEAALAEILSLFESSGGGAGGAGGEERGGERREPERGGSAPAGRAPESGDSGDLEGDFSLELPEEELPQGLARLFRAMAMRAGGGCDSLSLFNHLRGPESSWVIVPFRFDLDAVAFSGGFRIQLPYVRGGPGRFEAFFKASRGPLAEDWSFFVSFGGGRPPSLRIEMPKGKTVGAAASSRLDVLARSLAVNSCSVRSHERGDLPLGAERGAERAGFDLDA